MPASFPTNTKGQRLCCVSLPHPNKANSAALRDKTGALLGSHWHMESHLCNEQQNTRTLAVLRTRAGILYILAVVENNLKLLSIPMTNEILLGRLYFEHWDYQQ